MTNKSVFISFASPQADIAKRLSQALRKKGIAVFYSNDSIAPDEIAIRKIRKQLASDNVVFVPLFSEEYLFEETMSQQEYEAFVQAHRGNVKGRLCIIRMDGFKVDSFDKNYQYQSATTATFSKDMRKIVKAILSVVESEMQVVLYEDPKAAEAVLRERLLAEWSRIIERSKEKSLSTKSMSQIYMFGWLAACGIDEPTLNPLIATHYIKYIIKSTFRILKDKSKERVNIECGTSEYVSNLCTIRFLLFCFLIASGEKDYPEYVLNSMIEGLKRRDFAEQKRLFSSISLSEILVRNQSGVDRAQVVKEFINNLAAVARSLNISMSDIAIEEETAHRSHERMNKNAIIVSHNTVTHRIRMFIEDREGVYYKVMEILGQVIPRFNVIKSVSETLVPEKIASIRLDICCKQEILGPK